MTSIAEAIRAHIRAEDGASEAILRRIDHAVANDPSAELWVLRGDAIQLGDGTIHSLKDAEESYLHALEIDPRYADAFESLGHFYYAVLDDPQKSIRFFERAIALGAGRSASDGLTNALTELSELENEGAV
jgi:Tfp pilus assembly protein PilF